MGCSQKVVFKHYMREELFAIRIQEPSPEIREASKERLDRIAKPLDGLGSFEAIIAQIAAIQASVEIDIARKAVIIMCADNGVVSEGISQSGQEVTLAVARNMALHNSPVGRMAALLAADTFPVDIGINYSEKIEGVIDKKIRQGTRNFAKDKAMSEKEVIRAISIGIDMVRTAKEEGYQIIATGEMGIGNTTSSSAVASALLHLDAEYLTGRGAGLTDEQFTHKKQVISDAIQKYNLMDADAIDILQAVGGLDIAGLVGLCIGGAIYHVPIVLDGVISLVAALSAERIISGTKNYLIASHRGKEAAMDFLYRELDMHPIIDAQMALGEGTGAVMMLSLLDMALAVYHNISSFSDIHISPYERYS